MLIVFYKSDGEIYRVSTGYENLEEFFGLRANEFAAIFDCIYVNFNEFIFRNYFKYKIDITTKKLVASEDIKNLLN